MKYLFKEKLVEGLVKSRPNRFIMLVEVNGRLEKCHCPCTGRIGSVVFRDVPCLVSASSNLKRKTRYTVEAISLGWGWIGINQVDANKYFEFFLRKGAFKQIACGAIKREVSTGKSRIDFKVGETFIELKTLLIDLPSEGKKKFGSFERLIKHLKELTNKKAVLVTVYLYNAKPFVIPEVDKKSKIIQKVARNAFKKGVQNWQVNFEVNEEGVTLKKVFKLKLF